MALVSGDLLPCPNCSFPNGFFNCYVFPIVSIDFSQSKDSKINVYSVKCRCSEEFGKDREKLINAINKRSKRLFLEMAASQYIPSIHYAAYGID